ncbi:hypothetical protein VCHE09_3037, partial [Vibrio paracholerae HE-09]
MACAAG